jgi:hypothetical protein
MFNFYQHNSDGGIIMKHYAFDLDDTLINTGSTIAKIMRERGLPVIDPREPYSSLRDLLNKREISPEEYEAITNMAMDNAQPIEHIVKLLSRVIERYGEAHIISTRAHKNTVETLNILGRILTLDEIFKIHIHWAEATPEAIQKALEEQGLGDVKVYHLRKLVDKGITHFVDDLGFNVAAIIEKVPGLIPVWVKQPWTIDRLYKPEYMNHPLVEFISI